MSVSMISIQWYQNIIKTLAKTCIFSVWRFQYYCTFGLIQNVLAINKKIHTTFWVKATFILWRTVNSTHKKRPWHPTFDLTCTASKKTMHFILAGRITWSRVFETLSEDQLKSDGYGSLFPCCLTSYCLIRKYKAT